MRDPVALLARAITGYARAHGCAFRIGYLSGRPWASATFEGERVELELDDVEPGAAWLSELPDAELTVREHHVADLVVRPLSDSSVRVEALLLRDL
ncbi:hypothetical protein [uncultured Sphingomonas sp.]|uniref:hypothetical protein n=1 Tax=uncultured Sphingomonas sp. TaxID=158754 RepID=UPI0035CA9568